MNFENRPTNSLRPYSGNARTHSPKQIKQIARSIERFGFNNPVLVDDDDQIIAGHGRVEAAKLLNMKTVPTVRLSHLSEAEKKAYILADNRLAEKAGWDAQFRKGTTGCPTGRPKRPSGISIKEILDGDQRGKNGEVISRRDPYQLARLKAVALMAQQHAKRPGREHLPGRSFCLAVPRINRAALASILTSPSPFGALPLSACSDWISQLGG